MKYNTTLAAGTLKQLVKKYNLSEPATIAEVARRVKAQNNYCLNVSVEKDSDVYTIRTKQTPDSELLKAYKSLFQVPPGETEAETLANAKQRYSGYYESALDWIKDEITRDSYTLPPELEVYAIDWQLVLNVFSNHYAQIDGHYFHTMQLQTAV